MNEKTFCLLLGILSFAVTVGVSFVLIPALRRRHAGQPILEIGPAWHLTKAGTPTLGGLAFIVGILLAALFGALYLFSLGRAREMGGVALVLLFALLCGAIGFADDYQKLAKKKNQGLTAPQKYLLQLVASGVFLFLAVKLLGLETAVTVPFWGTRVELGVFYYPLALLYLTGIVNALNLTDGVDGLLATLVAVIAAFFLVFGFRFQIASCAPLGALLLGAALGFLCFNAHPAKVFMGDTGSLFLGGAVSGIGIVTGEWALFLLASGVFVIEAISVMLQVVYFKITHGKRLFLMAPLHHHFEKRGWSEWRVVGVFALAGIAFAVIAFLGKGG